MLAEADQFDGAVLHRVPRQARSREKVAQALAAAERLLASEGVGALSITRVAAEAGVSVGALHQYLPDRDAIVHALLTRYHARFERLMGELVARPVDPGEDVVRALVADFAALYRGSTGIRALGPRVEARDHKTRMVALVGRLLDARGIGSDEAVARTAFTAADAVLHEAFRDDPAGDPLLLAELELLLRTYLALE